MTNTISKDEFIRTLIALLKRELFGLFIIGGVVGV